MNQTHQEIVDKWLAGKATFEETEALWAQALNDSELFEYMQTVAGAHKVLAEKQTRIHSIHPQKMVKSDDLRYWVAAAAVVLISVIGGLLLKIDRDAHQLGISTIELMDLESGNTTRSGEGYDSKIDSLLNLGLKATVDGKKSKAVTYFDEILKNYPESPAFSVAALNLGILTFNDGKFENALGLFESVITKTDTDEFVLEKALWFKVYCLVNLKKYQEAKDTALLVYHKDGVYRKQAFIMIKRLDQQISYKTFDDDYELE